MTLFSAIKNLKWQRVFTLLSIIFFTCSLLIFINIFTIKILSANRAYINGESHYSKAQKDAARHLITYLLTEDKSEWSYFTTELSVPQGDGNARIGLNNNIDVDIIRKNFLNGRNHEDDLNDLIWLYKNFQFVPFIQKAIIEWEQGDNLINKLNSTGIKIKKSIEEKKLNDSIKKEYLSQINTLSNQLTINERNFSSTLGEGTRLIKNYLIYTNIALILIIICSVSTYFFFVMRKLRQTNKEIELKNLELTVANKELDKFVYSASHDLRSPIASLQGIVNVLKAEDDPQEFDMYLNLMNNVLTKQDQFISDIIDYSRNKRSRLTIETLSLDEIIEDVITQHKYIEDASRIKITKKLSVDKIDGDRLRLKIILNNLLSNAIKYSDLSKESPFISINASTNQEHCIIEIEDNGIGINNDFIHKVFDMFFFTDKNKGTGLGLYIVKDAVTLMNGQITVDSKINEGTKFTVSFPLLA